MKAAWWSALLVGWMVCIFLFSAAPGDDSASSSDVIVAALQRLGIGIPTDTLSFLVRKAAHACAYLILGALAFCTFRAIHLSLRYTVIWSFVLVAAYAVSDEVHQLFVPGRSGEARDVLIDVIAGVAAVVVMFAAQRRRREHGGHVPQVT